MQILGSGQKQGVIRDKNFPKTKAVEKAAHSLMVSVERNGNFQEWVAAATKIIRPLRAS